MKQIVAIALTGYKEYLRDRFAHICIFIALFLLTLSIALGTLTLNEQTRIMYHFGLTSIHLCCLGLVVFFGSFSMQKEIDRQTSLLILARPISRSYFLIGKYLAIFMITLTVWLLLEVSLFVILQSQVSLLNYFVSGLGIMFEMSVLLALAYFLSTVVRPTYTLFMVMATYLLGNWLEELMFFAERSKNVFFIDMAKIINFVVPNLYRANWRSFYLLNSGIQVQDWFWSFFHHLGWVFILLSLACFFYRKKDLV